MKRCVQQIVNSADRALSACDSISEAGACDKCPLRSTCLDDSSFLDVVTSFNPDHWNDFFGLADDVAGYMDEQDYIASLADSQRKEREYA